MKIFHLICAARPNFMKIAPLYHALKNENWCTIQIIHTGQHYDYHMSQTFFDDLDLPAPHYHLNGGSGSHAEQTSQTMLAYEQLCLNKSKPDLVIVVGDVNATMACSIVAKKLHLKVAHLEAGLRCFDRTLPEEINRLLTDAISDYYWTPSEESRDNLLREGVKPEHIHFVGNIMMDTYCLMKSKIQERLYHQDHGLEEKQYVVLTLHRPVNVDTKEKLNAVLETVQQISLPVIFPVHPRTKKTLAQLSALPDNIILVEPLSYIDCMSLVSNAAYVISDSGGIQEETTYLGIPCFTLRDSTERPITVTMGSNQLVTLETILEKMQTPKVGSIPPLWDGNTADRIKHILQNNMC